MNVLTRRLTILLATVGLVLFGAGGLQWLQGLLDSRANDRASELWGVAGERWNPGSRLSDFSFAGYAMGERPLPHPPVQANVRDFGAKGDGTTDDSDAFLAALASVDRGAVWVPAGHYVVRKVLRIDRPGLVLRGEGPQRTILRCPDPLSEVLGPAPVAYGNDGHWSWGGGFVWLEGQDLGSSITDIVATAKRGDRRLVVGSTERLAAGQIVRVVQSAADGSLWEHLHSRPTDPGSGLEARVDGRLVDFATRILELNGNEVVVERPLRVDVDPRWRPQLFSHEPTVTEVGVEELTIAFDRAPYAGHLVEAGYNGLFLEDVHQFWIRNVEVRNADSGVLSKKVSRFGTISGIRLVNDERAGAVTGHHGIALEGPVDILITKFRIETRFRHDLTVDTLSNGNVFSKGRGVDLNFDHHTGAPHDNLFTDLDAGPGTRLWDSGGPESGWGPHAGRRETIWNVRLTAVPGSLPDYPELTIVALSGVTKSPWTDQWVEALDSTTLIPQDLHLAQLERRLAN